MKPFSSFLLQTTLWVLFFFLALTAWSYFQTLTEEGAFQLGLPWVFYYQIQAAPETPYWNSQLLNLFKDVGLLWGLTAGLSLLWQWIGGQ